MYITLIFITFYKKVYLELSSVGWICNSAPNISLYSCVHTQHIGYNQALMLDRNDPWRNYLWVVCQQGRTCVISYLSSQFRGNLQSQMNFTKVGEKPKIQGNLGVLVPFLQNFPKMSQIFPKIRRLGTYLLHVECSSPTSVFVILLADYL